MKVSTSISRGAALKTNAGQLEPEHTHWTEIMLNVIDAVAEGCRIEQNDILFPPLQKEKNSRILIVQENKMIEVRCVVYPEKKPGGRGFSEEGAFRRKSGHCCGPYLGSRRDASITVVQHRMMRYEEFISS